MIEIPIWLLFVLVFSIIVLFAFIQDLNIKANRLKFDQIQIGIILNKSFEDITNDVNNLNKGIDLIDQKYEKIISKIDSR